MELVGSYSPVTLICVFFIGTGLGAFAFYITVSIFERVIRPLLCPNLLPVAALFDCLQPRVSNAPAEGDGGAEDRAVIALREAGSF